MPKKKRALSTPHLSGTGKQPGRGGEGAKTINAALMTGQANRPEDATLAEQAASGSERAPSWYNAYVLFPVGLALMVSINTLRNRFAYDDINQILNNDFIKSTGYLLRAFTSSVWSFRTDSVWKFDTYFRPLFTTAFTLNYWVFGEAPSGWHLVSVLINAAVTLMVFVVCRELTGRNWLSLVTATLFAVHPVHAESVAWVSGLPDPLMSLFVLPAFYCYLRYRKGGGKHLMAMALVLYFLALLCKETAIVLPVMIAYCEIMHFGGDVPLRRRMMRAGVLAGSFAAPAIGYLLLRYHSLGQLTGKGKASALLDPVLFTDPLVFTKYLRFMLVPEGYGPQHYTAPVTSMVSVAFAAPLALIILLAAAIARIKSQTLSFCAAWFLIWIAVPLASLTIFDPLFFAQERYLYLPSMGFCLAVALGIEWIATRRGLLLPGHIVAGAILAVLLIICSAATYEQNRTWFDTTSVFHHAVEIDPESAYARSSLSTAYFASGNVRAAEAEARKGIELDPKCIDAYINLSGYTEADGHIEQAIKVLERAKSLAAEQVPNALARVCRSLGLAYQRHKEYDRAEENLRMAVELAGDNYAPNRYYLGVFYLDQGRYAEARQAFEGIIDFVPPAFATIHLKLGLTYDHLGLPEQARPEYEKFLDLAAPSDPERTAVMSRLLHL